MFSKLLIYIHSSWNWAYYIHLVGSKTKANDIKQCNLLARIDQILWSLCIPVCVYKTLCLNRCRRSKNNHISLGRKKAGLDATSEDEFRPIPRLISYSGVMGDENCYAYVTKNKAEQHVSCITKQAMQQSIHGLPRINKSILMQFIMNINVITVVLSEICPLLWQVKG